MVEERPVTVDKVAVEISVEAAPDTQVTAV